MNWPAATIALIAIAVFIWAVRRATRWDEEETQR